MGGILGSLLVLISSPSEAYAAIMAPGHSTMQLFNPRARERVSTANFFNMEGSDNGTFASFGVVDFQSGLMNVPITSLTLDLTQDNAAFTHNGTLIFYLSTDTATNIDPGTSPLIYNAADVPTGTGTQLNSLLLLGAGVFTQSTNGAVDTFSFVPSAAVTSYLDGQISTGGPIRLVITPGDATVAATYAGFSNTEFTGPQLILGVPVPR
jgi:hypothetical protein